MSPDEERAYLRNDKWHDLMADILDAESPEEEALRWVAFYEVLGDAICGHRFDRMVCVAPVGHDGAHVTSNGDFPHGLAVVAAPEDRRT